MRILTAILSLLIYSSCLAGQGMIPYLPYKASGGGSYMTPAYVSSASVYNGACTTNASLSATAGNTLIMGISGAASQVVTGVTTYTGTTSSWTSLGSFSILDVDINLYIATVTTTGTVAARPTCTTAGDAGYAMLQYSGVALTSPQIGTAQSGYSASSTTWSTDSATTTTPALLVAMWANETADATITWGSGYTQRVNQTDHYHKIADRVTTASGDYNASGTDAAARDNVALMVALKAALQ